MKNNKVVQFIKDYVLLILAIIVIWVLLNLFLFARVNVSGPSMEPNLNNKQSLIVWRQAQIKHLSVVVFNAAGVDPNAQASPIYYVKRVIGLPGDKVAFKDGALYVNNQKVNQSFISQTEQTNGTQIQPGVSKIPALKNWDLKQLSNYWTADKGAVTVPKGKYFVLGDHRSVSNDSRYWGFVPKDKVMGVVNSESWLWPFRYNTNDQQRYNINSLGY
ncbi:signal peptidase I [Nicoliella lavandulae]|uniref:Signal peptidase I n=1 Tax=Nicoliella lavandulae TaxID=3082954 RepID=A0ABU8SJC4_9LACO